MRPRFPLYVPTKGRWEVRKTSRSLTEMGLPHYLVVEPQEVEAYERAVRGTLATVLPLDMTYKGRYELCDDLGLTRSTGPGPARNFIWDHSILAGHRWHWVMDDNIEGFWRLHENRKVRVGDGTCFRVMEDFCTRYGNVAMAGPNYYMFASRKHRAPPLITNTRIYSCNLIRNDVPFRWRGRYNEDTILSLDLLKAGWTTVQFNVFLQQKLTTQLLKGGNTTEFYAREGTLPKSRMLVRVHPDCSRLAWRFGREHHFVDYKRFTTPLVLRPGAENEPGADYGLELVPRELRKPKTRGPGER